MNAKGFLKELVLPIFVIATIAFLLSVIEYCNCTILFNGNKSDTILSSIIQIESLLFTIVVAVLTIRLNLIDDALKKNMEKFNLILIKYGYYGYVLFENQYERNYLKLIPKIDEKLVYSKENNLTDDLTILMLDKQNIEFCFKTALPDLKKYRKDHIEAVKYLLTLFLFIIIVALCVIYFDFGNLCLLKKSLNTGIFLLSIYSVFITYNAIKELFNYPFTINN
jgi:hypothetical protein